MSEPLCDGTQSSILARGCQELKIRVKVELKSGRVAALATLVPFTRFTTKAHGHARCGAARILVVEDKFLQT